MSDENSKTRTRPLAAAILIAAWTPFAAAQQATVVIHASGDNTIYQGPGYETRSCGAGSNFYAGTTSDGLLRRALVSFDVAGSVPPGATIDRAALTLDVNRSTDDRAATMTLHPVTEDWGEGGADCDSFLGGGRGAPARPGDATWLEARFQELAWLVPGGDFGDAGGAAEVPTFGPAVWDSAAAGNAGLATDVQRWLDDPAANHGWIVVGDESRSRTARRLSSREGSSPPVLTVDFTAAAGTGPCCFDSGDCTLADAAACLDQGGVPDPDVGSCSPNPCPQPAGACCNADESCSDDVARDVCEAAGNRFQGAGSACADPVVDCGLEPFVDPLPIPRVLEPAASPDGGPPRYEIVMTQEQQQLHRDLPPTDVWTYDGTYPGPTIEATAGEPIEVRWVNQLPTPGHYLAVDECAHGPSYWQDTARAVVHLHGGHLPARFDGQPEYHILPGESDVYQYPNQQLPATLWYHDHALGITRLNVYMGLAGFYLLRDPFERALDLPRGRYEIPLVIQDRAFHPDGSFAYPTGIENAFFGDKVLVNGKVWPYLSVVEGKYRLRIVNGSQARVYKLRFVDLADPEQTLYFFLIGTDGGLIDEPIRLDSITLAPAERLDVVFDFFEVPGSEIVLRNEGPGEPAIDNVMKFIVEPEPGHTRFLPSTLRPVEAIPEGEATVTRRFLLERAFEPCAGREWLIKSLDEGGNVIGTHWDEITEYPVLGTTEIWEFDNPSGMMHPMHIHLVMFQVLERLDRTTGEPLPLEAWEQKTWKDTVRVEPGTVVRVIARFEDYPGRFAYHCHLLDHEDHEMMRQFQATHDPAACDGDGACELGEDCVSCPADCATVSGAACGNGLCEVGDGEDCTTCPGDCAGGDGGAFCCGADVGCDDARCTADGFFCRAAPRVAACCGDRLCEGQESVAGCFVDCGEPCEPGPGTLCLNGGRFRVEVEWQDFVGGTGSGRVVPFGADDSGLFWFFAADNWELLVKVLDGCGFNDRFWVFAAATTNVGYTLSVTDTWTGAVREYTNPLGVAAPAVTDTGAFVCP